MNDRQILKLGGKAIRFQRFAGWVLTPALLAFTIYSACYDTELIAFIIGGWIILGIAYTIAEGIRRIVMGAISLPRADE